MPSLICLGACNPTRAAIDKRVHEFRQRRSADVGGDVLPIDDDIARELRTLKHTHHVPVKSKHADDLPLESFKCAACGTTRGYGTNPAYDASKPLSGIE